MPQLIKKPKLVNRGAAGLLNKLDDAPVQPIGPGVIGVGSPPPAQLNKIDPALAGFIADINTLVFDPDNARLHPERNLQAIKESLTIYGQVKPVVVQKWQDHVTDRRPETQTNHIVAGNGTKQAATELGWTQLAAVFVDMTNAEAAGYGLADNRTAELAKWDFATVAKLDKLVTEAGLSMSGWTMDELEVLRAADWTPPVVEDGGAFGGGGDDAPLLVSFTPDQHDPIKRAIDFIRNGLGMPEMDQAECLMHVCSDWLASKAL
jgi:hypothetical protein